MKHITVITFICMVVAVPAFAKSLKNEAEYKKEWCAKYNGEVDYKTHDKTTVD
jgi:hypothetical protein